MSILDRHGDAELVEAVRSGDHLAWAALMRRHAPRLAAYLGARLRRPAVVDALVAEAVVAGWQYLGELEDGAGFAAWFRKLGAGIAMRWAREHPGEALEEPFPAGRIPAGSADRSEQLAILERAIGRLSEPQRMALELRWRGGLVGAELGAALRLDAAEADRLADEAENIVAEAVGSAG